MANWLYKIELNSVINKMTEKYNLEMVEEDCPEEVKIALANEIRKAPPIAHLANRIMKCKAIAAVNRTLNTVFDRADENLVWCGF